MGRTLIDQSCEWADNGSLLRARKIEKSFGATRALRGVDFDLNGGEIHALVGANGAGKSTLARTIAGLQRPDGGMIELNGHPISFDTPRDAIRAGVTMVTQETSLATHLTVLENIFLPELAKPGRIDWRRLRDRADTLIAELSIEMHFSLSDEVGRLSMANRQIVEILKVLALDSQIIFLDEPTTSLSPYECNQLLELAQRLASRGHGLILVTHRMEEILNFTDRLTVLREGELVTANVQTASIDGDALIRMMVGREIQDIYSRRDQPVKTTSSVAFRAENLAVGQRVRDVSFSVNQGEIVGLGGLVGAGRTEALESVFGLTGHSAGTMELFGEPYAPKHSRDAIIAGIGFVGEDRRRFGLIPDFNVRENLLLVHMAMQRGFRLNYRQMRQRAEEVVQSLGLDPERLNDEDILGFSGGMQQKIILARWLLAKPRLLILDEPTRGVDIETRSSIYKALRALVADGVAILIISSDFEELLGIADRVVVISDGRSIADVPVAYLDIERLTMLAAPRTSSGQIGELLQTLADRYKAAAMWIHQDTDAVFCFDSAAHPDAPSVLTKGTHINPSADFANDKLSNVVTVPLTGNRNHGLGKIALTFREGCVPPTSAELLATVQTVLHQDYSHASW